MKDRKMNYILIIAICLILAVAGCIYEIYSMKDAATIESILDMGNGVGYEESD